MNRNVVKGIEQFKVVSVLTQLSMLVMVPPNQLSAITNESRLFLTTMDSECAITCRPDLLIIVFETEVKNTYKSNTDFYY